MNIAQTWNKALSVLVFPAREWRVISVNGTGRNALGYLIIFSLLVGIAQCAMQLIKGNFTLSFLKVGAETALLVFLISLLIALLTNIYAKNFGSTSTYGKALQLIVFSLTPTFFGLAIASFAGFYLVFTLIFGIYSIVLLYIGLPIMLGTPQNQRFPYTGLIALTAILLGALAWLLFHFNIL